ncbi:MarR family winged helix-turn-helix transcriptional regulator [Nonomuraea zeae]|uniref:MarR family winged helix-turn-helix transcriptional regulator n=1 Tax=Nonomuraea zeae TaxID=1642303 RepID=UPI001F0D3813|nr:MarR family transcriptional regulator [Nonomuraea zeae]
MTDPGVPAAAAPDAPPPRVSYLVFRLERRIRACLDEALARHGMTTTEYMALSELRLRDAPSSADLARIAFVTPQAMNLVIRDLEQRGLIRRDPHPRGGRALRTRLTPKGLNTLRGCDRSLDSIEAVMLAEIDDPDRTTLAETLTLCAQALHSDTRALTPVLRSQKPPPSPWP